MSIFSISNFITSGGGAIGIPTDLSRPNLFEAEISTPLSLTRKTTSVGDVTFKDVREAIDLGVKQVIQLNCKATSIPGTNFGTADVRERGILVAMPNDIIHDDFSMTFYLDNIHSERTFFKVWSDTIINPITGEYGYYDDYVSTIIVKQLDKALHASAKVKLVECYPKTIGSVEYSYDSSDAIAEFTVTFGYKTWTSESVTKEDIAISVARQVALKKPTYL